MNKRKLTSTLMSHRMDNTVNNCAGFGSECGTFDDDTTGATTCDYTV